MTELTNSDSRPVRSGSGRLWLFSGLVSLGALVVSVAVLDLGMRAIGYMPIVSHGWHLDEPQWRVPDERVILAPTVALSDDFYEGAVDGETIVALGDSFTAGFRVADDWRYPEIMRRILRRAGHPANIMNFGMGDSGPDQQLRLLKEIILPRVTPGVVVWSFYSNDIEDNIRQSAFAIEDRALAPQDMRDHWLFKRRALFDGIPLPASVKASSPLLRLSFLAMEAAGFWGQVDPEAQERIDWSVAKVHLAVQEMERLSVEHGFEVYYVLIAPQSTYLADATDPEPYANVRPYRLLQEVLRDQDGFVSADFETVDAKPISPEFDDLDQSYGPDGIFADGERDPAQYGDRHFNEAGFLLLAETVASRIVGTADDEVSVEIPFQ